MRQNTGDPEQLQSADRRRADEERRKSEEKYRLLVENTKDVVFQISPDGIVKYCSPAITAFGGYDADKEIGQHVGKYFADSSQLEQILALIADSIDKQESRSVEFLYRPKEGVAFWVEVTGKPFVENNQVTAIHCIMRDITDRSRADRALRDSERKLRDAARIAGLGYWERDIDADADAVIWSDEAFLMFGIKPQERQVSLKMVLELTHPEDRERVSRAVDEALAGGARYDVKYRAIRPDGEIRWLHSLGDVDRDAAGRPVRMSGIVQDITERKRAEEEMKRTAEELRNLAMHLQSIREEERANLARELHDNLGQLLTALRFDLAWLGRRAPGDRDETKQEDIEEKVRKMETLVADAAAIVRRVSFGLRPTGIEELGLWPAIEAEAARFTERTGIVCAVRPSDRPRGPSGRDAAIAVFRIVQEALTNIANHAEATAVEISCAQSEGRHTLSIVDNGRGIDAARNARPSSLGLIGMRERARSFGGEISVGAAPGKGTTVRVSIPLEAYREDA
jgi:two-component system sensor histidine kinase UhpB